MFSSSDYFAFKAKQEIHVWERAEQAFTSADMKTCSTGPDGFAIHRPTKPACYETPIMPYPFTLLDYADSTGPTTKANPSMSFSQVPLLDLSVLIHANESNAALTLT